MANESLHTAIGRLYDNQLSNEELQGACDNLMGVILLLYEEDERQKQLKKEQGNENNRV
ncbi:MAG: hypothetical protein N4A44_00985 [Alphaproteobacteria bacterium]|jgi:hypothetical protein|nr:hypothetical protein [Alphaproteobacteria bacterium]